MGKKRQQKKLVGVQRRRSSKDQGVPSVPGTSTDRRPSTSTLQQLVIQEYQNEEEYNPNFNGLYFSQVLQVLQESPVDVTVPVEDYETAIVTHPPQFLKPTPCSLHMTADREEEEKETDEKEKNVDSKAGLPTRGETRKWMYKNVLGVGLSFVFVFSAFQGLQNLQSSLNSTGGLGLASLAILYAFFTLSGFITPGLIKLVGTKYVMLAGFLCHLIYTMANFYPSWYTFVPASIILGLASGPIWAAGNVHLVKVAIASAPKLEQDQDHLISVLVGIFFFFFQGAQIPGNLASSLIFFPYSSMNKNSTFLEDESVASNLSNVDTCGHFETAHTLDTTYLYILASVYFVMISLGIFCLLCMVNHLPIVRDESSGVQKKLKLYFRDPIIDLFKMMKGYRMTLVIPIAIFNGLEQSFAFGTFTEAIVADCFGTYLVGFSIIVLGVTSGLLSIAYSKLVKYIPRYAIFLFGGTINIILVVFLLLWNPTPSYVTVFLFAMFWGAADAVWNTMTTSLVGTLFPSQSEMAYSIQRIWQAVGVMLGFISAAFFSLSSRCYLMLVAVLVALLFNLVLELKTQSKKALLPSCVHTAKYSVSSRKDKTENQEDRNETDV